MATSNAAEQMENAQKPVGEQEAKLTSKTVDILGLKEISGEVEMRGQKVIFPLEETLTPSARFTDLESNIIRAEEAGNVARVDRNKIMTDSAGAKNDLQDISLQTKKEVADMAQFLELLRGNQENFKIINLKGEIRLPDNLLQTMSVADFMRDQGMTVEGVDLLLLTNKTSMEDYMNLKRYGFDVDPIQSGTTGSGENTGVKLTYTLADGNKETILIAFTTTGKPKSENDNSTKSEQEAKVINLDDERAKKDADEKEKADDKAKGLV